MVLDSLTECYTWCGNLGLELSFGYIEHYSIQPKYTHVIVILLFEAIWAELVPLMQEIGMWSSFVPGIEFSNSADLILSAYIHLTSECPVVKVSTQRISALILIVYKGFDHGPFRIHPRFNCPL